MQNFSIFQTDNVNNCTLVRKSCYCLLCAGLSSFAQAAIHTNSNDVFWQLIQLQSIHRFYILLPCNRSLSRRDASIRNQFTTCQSTCCISGATWRTLLSTPLYLRQYSTLYRQPLLYLPSLLTFKNIYFLPHTAYLHVLCGSQNKQRLFPYKTLSEWFL
jgi:hypothetical protein